MPDPVNVEELRKLESPEALCLYWKAKGFNNDQIAANTPYNKNSVTTHISRGYKKLPQLNPFDDKHAAFMRIYRQEMIYLWEDEDWWNQKQNPPASTPQPNPQKEGEKTEDSKIPVPASNPTAKPATNGQRSSLPAVIAAIIGILVVLAILFVALRFLSQSAPEAARVPEQTQPAIPQNTQRSVAQAVATDTALPQPTSTTAVAIVPADTQPAVAVPTNTAVPPTPIPTDTAIPAQQPFTFSDEFDGALDPVVWGNTDNFTTSDGYLVAYEDGWIFVGDASWQNYQVEVKVEENTCNFNAFFTVGLRAQDEHNMIAFRTKVCQAHWARVVKGERQEVTNTDVKPGYTDVFTVFVNGSTYGMPGILEFSDSVFVNGKVGLYLNSRMKVDYIRITSLP